jgi:O-antigen ligase
MRAATMSPAPIGARRAAARWPLALLAALAGGVVGVLAVRSPVLAGVATASVIGAAAVASRPAAVFGTALVFLAYSPENVPGLGPLSHPELPKALIFAATAGIVLVDGVRARLLLPVLAYIAAALMAVAHDDLAPGLTPAQIVSTLVTLGVAWLVLAVRWDWRRDAWLLRFATVLPVLCVAFGAVLQVTMGDPLFRAPTPGDPFSRLQGASIAATLGLGAFVSCAIAVLCHRIDRWPLALPLAAANGVILFMTLSRGASLALGIALLGPALRFVVSDSARRSPRALVARAAVVLALAGAVAAVVVPQLQARGDLGYTSTGEKRDATSGREEAWSEFYAIAKQSPLFGHGIGSGPITKIEQEGFLNQHNEYLRLFLEGGYVGGGLILACMIVSVFVAIRRAPPHLRLNLTGMALGLASVAATDNPLSSPNAIVPFTLALGICASAGVRRDDDLVPRDRP